MPGIATPELAIAVAEVGGLGMISAVRHTPDRLAATLDSIRLRTGNPIGVNFLIPFIDRQTVETAASGARVVEFFYGEPDAGLVKLVHGFGALVSWQIGSLTEAVTAVNAGCDLIVAQGTEAGGHVRGNLQLLPLLAEVRNAVRIPVLASGGIATAQQVAAILAAGADGVRIGTRFIASTESGAHPDYVKAILNAKAADTVITETFSVNWPNAPHRVLRSCVEAAISFEGDIVAEMDVDGTPMPVRKFATAVPTKSTKGTVAAMALYAGESVSETREIKSARAIIEELMPGAGIEPARTFRSSGF
jgi:nitronate monooxygenase